MRRCSSGDSSLALIEGSTQSQLLRSVPGPLWAIGRSQVLSLRKYVFGPRKGITDPQPTV